MEKTRKRDSETAARVNKVADITGVTPRSVYRIIKGEQENEAVMTAYMEMTEGEKCLVEAVKQLVPKRQTIL